MKPKGTYMPDNTENRPNPISTPFEPYPIPAKDVSVSDCVYYLKFGPVSMHILINCHFDDRVTIVFCIKAGSNPLS